MEAWIPAFAGMTSLWWAGIRQWHGAGRTFGLFFNMDSVTRFAKRFSNDLETIRKAGLEITSTD